MFSVEKCHCDVLIAGYGAQPSAKLNPPPFRYYKSIVKLFTIIVLSPGN